MSTEWICIEQAPDSSVAARVESYLKDRGLPVRVVAVSTADGGFEVQVPVDRLTAAVDELQELDTVDEEDERRSGPE